MGQPQRMFFRLFPAVLLFVILFAAPAFAGDQWLPVTQEELEMKQYALKPGAHAVLLYREEETDDNETVRRYYSRIKILSEEGKKYADIELPFLRNAYRITDIKARTIRPDGTIIEFKGEIFEKTIVKARGIKLLAKTFTLQDVQVGSIIEYRYMQRWDVNVLIASRWILQHELPTRRAVFRLKPYTPLSLMWIHVRVPGQSPAQKGKDGFINLELQDIPAFEEEEFMPPEDELKSRVDFFYARRIIENTDKFWQQEGKEWNDIVEQFIGKRGGIIQAARETVLPDDPPETKVRKLYARVQQVRNLSYEREKTEKEEKREKLKDNAHIEDVWKRGYGWRNEINRLFVGLARAAGLEASVIRVSERDEYFFSKLLLDWRQLNGEVALVLAGGKEYYLDPGTLFCPFGLLAWERTGVHGLRPDKQGGTFVTTPQPRGDQALIKRVARFRVEEDGTLEGKLRVEFLGLQALRRRLSAREEDEAGRRKEIEDEIKGWLPASAQLEIENIANWESTDEPLTVDATVTLPNFAASTGRRLLLHPAVFQVGRKHPFQQVRRIHPVYFRYPYQEVDEITLELPEGFRVENLPEPRNHDFTFASLKTARQSEAGKLIYQRRFTLEGFIFQTQYYPALRTFFETVGTADEERIILQRAEAAQRD